MRAVVLLIAVLLVGCATTGIVAVTPYTSTEVEAARAQCLEQPAGVWMEMRDRAQCMVPDVPRGGDPT